MNQIQEITSLVLELNKHRHAYYNLNTPTITDKEYDQLFDELQNLEAETGFILSSSPTQTVGYYPVSSLKKVQHRLPSNMMKTGLRCCYPQQMSWWMKMPAYTWNWDCRQASC